MRDYSEFPKSDNVEDRRDYWTNRKDNAFLEEAITKGGVYKKADYALSQWIASGTIPGFEGSPRDGLAIWFQMGQKNNGVGKHELLRQLTEVAATTPKYEDFEDRVQVPGWRSAIAWARKMKQSVIDSAIERLSYGMENPDRDTYKLALTNHLTLVGVPHDLAKDVSESVIRESELGKEYGIGD